MARRYEFISQPATGVTNTARQDDLAAAGKLVHNGGCHRRDRVLADAKKAVVGASPLRKLVT